MARRRTLGKKRKSRNTRGKKRGRTYRKMRRMRGGDNTQETKALINYLVRTPPSKYKFIYIKSLIDNGANVNDTIDDDYDNIFYRGAKISDLIYTNDTNDTNSDEYGQIVNYINSLVT